jgi:hypothetical protein
MNGKPEYYHSSIKLVPITDRFQRIKVKFINKTKKYQWSLELEHFGKFFKIYISVTVDVSGFQKLLDIFFFHRLSLVTQDVKTLLQLQR